MERVVFALFFKGWIMGFFSTKLGEDYLITYIYILDCFLFFGDGFFATTMGCSNHKKS